MRSAILVFAVWAAGVTGAIAQDVTLSARDGSVTVSGRLLSYDGEFYRVDTDFGPLTLDGSGVSCEGPGCPNLTDYVAELTWAGPEGLVDRLVPPWVQAFAAAEGYSVARDADGSLLLTDGATGAPAARVRIVAAGTSAALDLVARNEVDFALARSDMTDAQIASAQSAGFALPDFARNRRVVALDALVPVVSPANPVRSLTLDQLSQMVAGEIADWSAVAGADMPVELHLAPRNSAVTQAVEAALLAAFGRAPAQTVRFGPAPVAAVLADPFALGMAALSEAEGARMLSLQGPCGFPATASAEALKTEEYPLTLPVYLHQPPRRLPRIGRDLVAFIRSEAAQASVRGAGFVDLSVDRIPFAMQGARLSNAILTGADGAGLAEVQRMVGDLRDHDRLTMAFRFRDGSSALDSHSQSNIALLADALERGAYDGHDIILAGFSDGQGDAAGNLSLSRQRARAVRDALLAEAPGLPTDLRAQILAKGYGEAAPIACDEVEWGSRLNRRVEVWVRQR